MGPDAAAHTNKLVGQLVDPDLDVKNHAMEVLVQMDKCAVANVVDGLRGSADFSKMEQHAVGHVARELGGGGANLRDQSAWTLFRMGETASVHVEPLINKLHDLDASVWKSAGEALVRLGPTGATALANRLEVLSNSDAYARMRIEEVLSWMGALGAVALAAKLDAPKARVRMHTARALGRMGTVAAPHAESLGKLLHDNEAG